ncbi:MAG: Zn-ribbon domain-containing OB-fold protein [Candidatus Hermodarchaeota archaeon]|nr:Zn-ribbon domain-containing OB-fold protein [Candidatus Hermodarchaeota archaeon]
MSKNMKTVPGTPLSSKELKSDKVIAFNWRPNAKYAWSAGIAYGRFLEELKEGRIIGRRCRRCGRIIVPPRMFCEQCFAATDEWVYVKDTGTINTFSLSYLDADANRIKDPIMVAVIDIDGASPGIGILHKLGNVDPKKIDVGMKVKAVWKPPEEREGAVTDILFWEPL